MNTLRSASADADICRLCALRGPTCCRTEPGREEFCFPLSVAEKERIREVLPDTGGFALQENTEAFVNGVLKLFPGEEDLVRALFPPRKEHLRLAVDATGACRFLGPQGCLVPREARPYYCLLFPFWITGNSVMIFDAPGCLARRESGGETGILRRLGMTESQVRDLHGRLRLVWGLPPRRGMNAVKRTF